MLPQDGDLAVKPPPARPGLVRAVSTVAPGRLSVAGRDKVGQRRETSQEFGVLALDSRVLVEEAAHAVVGGAAERESGHVGGIEGQDRAVGVV